MGQDTGDSQPKGKIKILCFLVSLVCHLLTVNCSLGFAAEQQVSAYSRAAAAANERDLDAALRYAREALAEDPGHVDALFLIGQLYYFRQEMGKAEESWKRALKLAPAREDVKEALEKLERETGVEKTLARGDTHPFVLRFAEGQVPVDTSSLRQMLRDAYRKIGQQFNYFPDHAIPVLLTSDADFEKVSGLTHEVGGLYDGKIRLPLKAGSLSGDRLQAVFWHEYTHAVVHDLSRGACPIWLQEGLAQTQESRVATVEVDRVRTALEEGKLPAWDLLWSESSYNEASLILNYQISFMIARYLVQRWSWREIRQLLERIGQGVPTRDALRAQYRTDPAVLEKEWRAWLRKNL